MGVGASFGRGVFLSDFATRAAPVRQAILSALGRHDPFASERAREMHRLDGRFAENPVSTFLHIGLGGFFLVLAPLQFSPGLRSRHVTFHRWSGRLLVAAAIIVASTGFYFGLFVPYAGRGESIVIAVFGGLLLYSLWKAIAAIRSRDASRHREWMIRVFALCLAISTVRVVAAALDLTLTPAGLDTRTAFVLSLWTGWGATLGAAEIWIRQSRSRSP
jgi:uncharacterized membrane protein